MATKNALTLKLLIDTKGNKVLFAEAGKDVVDFLFSLLALPMATVIKLITKESMVGCISNLYKSVESLDQTYVVPNQSKSSLLSPKANASNTLFLTDAKINTEVAVRKYYRCLSISSSYDDECEGYSYHDCKECRNYITNVRCTSCPSCKCPMVQEMQFIDSAASPGNITSSANGFVTGVVTYTVMDDLSVMPMSTISGITMLNKFQVKDITALQEKIVKLELHQGLELLKASLQSKTVLTDVFLKNKRKKPAN